MKRGITIGKYIDSKQITLKEIEETFTEVRRIEIDSAETKGKCANCKNTTNQ